MDENLANSGTTYLLSLTIFLTRVSSVVENTLKVTSLCSVSSIIQSTSACVDKSRDRPILRKVAYLDLSLSTYVDYTI